MGEHDFGWALAQLKAGRSVCRVVWRERGMDIYIQEPGEMDLPYIAMHNMHSQCVVWTEYHEDLLATDWEVVE